MNILRQGEFARFLEQVRHPQLRTWIIMNPASIGDTATVCALAHEFVKHHGHGITMIVPPDHIAVTNMFPNRFLRVLTADRPTMLSIINNFIDANRFDLDVPFCGHPYDHGDCRGDELFYLFKYPGRGGISLTDLFRYMLRLPWDAQIERPTILPDWDAEALRLAESIGMPIGKSVLLFPANSSPHPRFPDVFWETLATRLADNGQRVFTNMKGGNFRPDTMPIVGTTPVEVPIHLALSLVQLAGRTICSAHGMQYLQLLGGKFRQMTVAMPIGRQFGDWEMNYRKQYSTSLMAQYMYPELCLDLPFAEFSVPFDGTEDELKRVAVAIADESFDDSNCLQRAGSNGRSYLDEHRDWMSGLVEPVAR
jgi:hypothetical protein